MRSRVGDEARQRVEQRRFAGAGAAGDDDVQPGLDRPFQQHHHLGREGLEVEQVFELQRIGAEAANRNARPVQGQRRNDGVDARAVRQAGVDHRADFVDAPADLRHDAVDDLHQVVVVAERDAGLFHLAAALDVDVLRAVDQDVADRRVLQQQLERAEAERLVEHLFDQPLALVAVEQRVFGVAQVFDDEADFAAQHVAFQVAHARQVELVDQLAVNRRLRSSNSTDLDSSVLRMVAGLHDRLGHREIGGLRVEMAVVAWLGRFATSDGLQAACARRASRDDSTARILPAEI